MPGELIQEDGAHAVKLEGADDVIEHITALTRAGIPVCSHLGLTPQSVLLHFVHYGRKKTLVSCLA